MLHDDKFSITFITYGSGTVEMRNTWYSWGLIPSNRLVMASPGTDIKMVTIPGRADPYDLTDYLTGSVVKTPRAGTFSFYADNTAKNLQPKLVVSEGGNGDSLVSITIKGKNDEKKTYSISADITSGSGNMGSVLPINPDNFSNPNMGTNTETSDPNTPDVTTLASYFTKYKWQKIYDDMESFLNGKQLVMFLEQDPTHGYLSRISINPWQPDGAFSTIEINYQSRVNAKRYAKREAFTNPVGGV